MTKLLAPSAPPRHGDEWHIEGVGSSALPQPIRVTRKLPGRPWYVVLGPRIDRPNSERRRVAREETAAELTVWLNGGEEPRWFFYLETEPCGELASDRTGRTITAMGPMVMVDEDHPVSGWESCGDMVSVAERKYLIGCIMERRRPR